MPRLGRLIAVGDVHGKLSKLESLLHQLGLQLDDRLVFLGDYIDRGPDCNRAADVPARSGLRWGKPPLSVALTFPLPC